MLQKMAVLRIMAKRTKTGEGIKREVEQVLEGNAYRLTGNPFFVDRQNLLRRVWKTIHRFTANEEISILQMH